MERVTIKIEVNVDDRQLDALLAKLAALESQAKLTGNSFDGLTKNTKDLSDASDKNSKSMSRMSDKMKKADKDSNMLSRAVKNFGKMLSGLAKFALKAFLINLAAGIASIGVITAAFKLGELAVRAYKGALNVLAAGAAAVATALSVAAAGQREYNAAMQATKYGGMQNAVAQLRTINTNTKLAVLGAEALNAAFAGVSQKGRMSGGIDKALTALGDFAVASGQADKSMGAAGKFLGELSSSGKMTKQIADMAAEVGPQFQKAVTEWRKKNGNATYQEFIKALNAGELSTEVAGALDNVNQTLFGSFKRNFQLIKEQFADMGQPLLPHFTEAMNRIARILQVTILRIQSNMQMFARGSMVDSLVGAFEKLSNWIVKTFNEDLPKAIGMIDRIRDRFKGFGDTFTKIVAALEPIREAGKVLWEAFGPFVKSIFTEFGQGVKDLGDLFVKNKSGLIDFGDSLKTLLESIGNLFGEIKKTIVQSLPTLSKLVNVLAQIVNLITALVGGFNSMGEGGSVGMLIGLATLGLAMKGGKDGGMGAGGGRMGLLRGGMGAGGGGAWFTRAGTAGGAIGTATAIGTSLAGNYLGNGGSRSGFGTAGMLASGALMLGSMGKLPGYSKLIKGRMPTGMYGPPKPAPAQSSMGGALSYAAPLAGGAIAGGFTSDFALKRFGKNTSSMGLTAGGTLSGAAGGAIAGAAIGSVIPVVGTAVGALLGGVGGALVGFINSGKMKKQARQQAEKFVGNYDSAIEKSLESGDILGAKNLLEQMKKQSEQASQGAKHTDSFNKKYKELEQQLSDKVQPAVELYDKTLGGLSQTLGMSKDKIKELSKTLGIDFVQSTEDFKAAALGLSPGQANIEGMRGIFYNALTDTFNQPIAMQEMQQAISAEDRRLADIIAELGVGEIKSADIGKYLQTALGFETQNTGDPFKAFENIYSKLALPSSYMYRQNGIFAGQGKTLAPQMSSLLNAAFRDFVENKGLESASLSLSNAGEKLLGMQGSQAEIQKVLSGKAQKAMTGDLPAMFEFLRFMQLVTGKGVGEDKAATQKALETILGKDRVQELKADPLVNAMHGLQGAITTLTNVLSPGLGGPSGEQQVTAGMPGIPNTSRTLQSAIPLPAAQPVSSSVTYGGSTVSIQINGTDYASKEALAQEIMRKFLGLQRNATERK